MNFLQRYQQLGEKLSKIPIINIFPSIRINNEKISHEELLKRLQKQGVVLEKIPFTKNGYWIKKSQFSLGAIIEYLLGYYYIQESAAQIPVEVLDPKSNELILDACAAPGGKTTQISQLMKNKGTIVAIELKQHRLIALKSSVERMQTENVIVYKDDARNIKKYSLLFDKILLDAPCSGNYVTDMNWFKKRSFEGVQKSAGMQRKLIESCVNVLKKDGILVYSTCTLEPEENELNIQWALDNLPVKLENINITIGDDGLANVFGKKLSSELKKCRRFWPWKTNTEGFFIAKLRKC
ncbi:RsmB/NOP family class I SAM-dependent RNA methyltransferase [Candidatus Woesearchaeota archaeon]|nr:RsmB/NOP family class I SAM-dependent RNA methyltransferase [Candidatus Woesearchaeota archaeon]